DRDKRMLMNFGPINQRGGEKRLNVIFSRAKHHMAVVSSIRHQDITNDYNDGANTLRNFLQYAENLSKGNFTAARSVLENLNPLNRRSLAPAAARDAVTEQLAAALRSRGHQIDSQVGQSRFRCDLAVRDPNSQAYALGLLVDTETHYGNSDLVDRYLTQPAILRAFGWQIMHVLTKDWFHEPDAVIERIERLLRGEKLESPELPEQPPAQEKNSRAAPVASTPPKPTVAPPEPLRRKSPATPNPSPHLPSGKKDSQRYFECTEGGSRKFWEITVASTSFTVRFGRIGTNGQSQQKSCATEAEAMKTAEQLIVTKIRRGYSEVK